MKSRLDLSQYSQFLKCYSFNIDICIKLLNSVIFVGDIKARIPFSFFNMNWILVFIWHRFNTVHWNSLRLFLCLQIHCMSNACVDGYTVNYKLHVFIIIWVSKDQRSRMVQNTRSTGFESWLRLSYTLFTMHLQHFYNTSRFLRLFVLFVWICNFYQYHIWNHLTHDPFNFLCIEYLQICCANNIYEIYRTSIREVFAMFTKPLIKNIHLAALKAFYIAIRKLKVCWDFSLFFPVCIFRGNRRINIFVILTFLTFG